MEFSRKSFTDPSRIPWYSFTSVVGRGAAASRGMEARMARRKRLTAGMILKILFLMGFPPFF